MNFPLYSDRLSFSSLKFLMMLSFKDWILTAYTKVNLLIVTQFKKYSSIISTNSTKEIPSFQYSSHPVIINSDERNYRIINNNKNLEEKPNKRRQIIMVWVFKNHSDHRKFIFSSILQ